MKRVLLIGSDGYVGSQPLKNIAHDVNLVAVDIKTGMDFMDMSDVALSAFDEILFFAGVSNVADANRQPHRAVAENVVYTLCLLERMAAHTRLIYASTGSLLSNGDSLVANEQRENAYDASKLSFDLVAKYMGKRVVGLRMGTVSGWSPKMRWHLIFNAMNRSAIEEGRVYVTNPDAMRSILFHDDLAERVMEIIEDDSAQGIYPLASYTMSIGELAHEVAKKMPASGGQKPTGGEFRIYSTPAPINGARPISFAFLRNWFATGLMLIVVAFCIICAASFGSSIASTIKREISSSGKRYKKSSGRANVRMVVLSAMASEKIAPIRLAVEKFLNVSLPGRFATADVVDAERSRSRIRSSTWRACESESVFPNSSARDRNC